MANSTFGTNILPKNNTVTLGNSNSPWNIVSPNLTGTPVAPTATTGTNTTQVATTAFVKNSIDAIAPSVFITTLGFSIAVTDWSSTAPYTYTFTNASIGDNCTIDVYPDFYDGGLALGLDTWARVQRNAGAGFKATKVSGGVQFTVKSLPTDTITGTIRVIGTTSNHNYVQVQETTMPISKGGTGAANVAGAKANLGLNNVENKSSATIRGELTSANVTTALGFTPKSEQQAVASPTTSNEYSTAFIDSITQNENGVITATKKYIRINATDTSSKIFILGSTAQSSNGSTFSQDTAYVGTNGHVYSNGKQTVNLSDAQTLSNKTYSSPVCTGSISLGRKSETTVGSLSVACGLDVTASGYYSHAEGRYTTSSGIASHAEGQRTEASGENSHTEGCYTIANHASQHVFGEYNVADTSVASATSRGTYIEIVGKGTGTNARSNARTLDWSGNERLAGDVYVGANSDGSGGKKLVRPGSFTWGDLYGA